MMETTARVAQLTSIFWVVGVHGPETVIKCKSLKVTSPYYTHTLHQLPLTLLDFLLLYKKIDYTILINAHHHLLRAAEYCLVVVHIHHTLRIHINLWKASVRHGARTHTLPLTSLVHRADPHCHLDLG